jgi:hypothetical protein
MESDQKTAATCVPWRAVTLKLDHNRKGSTIFDVAHSNLSRASNKSEMRRKVVNNATPDWLPVSRASARNHAQERPRAKGFRHTKDPVRLDTIRVESLLRTEILMYLKHERCELWAWDENSSGALATEYKQTSALQRWSHARETMTMLSKLTKFVDQLAAQGHYNISIEPTFEEKCSILSKVEHPAPQAKALTLEDIDQIIALVKTREKCLSHFRCFKQKGYKFKSFDHLLAGIEYSLRYRRRIRTFLTSLECSLFGNSVAATVMFDNENEIDSLLDTSGSNFSTLHIIEQLQQQGYKFNRLTELSEAVSAFYAAEMRRTRVLSFLSLHCATLFKDPSVVTENTPLSALDRLLKFAHQTAPHTNLLHVLSHLAQMQPPLLANSFAAFCDVVQHALLQPLDNISISSLPAGCDTGKTPFAYYPPALELPGADTLSNRPLSQPARDTGESDAASLHSARIGGSPAKDDRELDGGAMEAVYPVAQEQSRHVSPASPERRVAESEPALASTPSLSQGSGPELQFPATAASQSLGRREGVAKAVRFSPLASPLPSVGEVERETDSASEHALRRRDEGHIICSGLPSRKFTFSQGLSNHQARPAQVPHARVARAG